MGSIGEKLVRTSPADSPRARRIGRPCAGMEGTGGKSFEIRAGTTLARLFSRLRPPSRKIDDLVLERVELAPA